MNPKKKLRKFKVRKKIFRVQRRAQYLDISTFLGFGSIGSIVGYVISGDLRGAAIGAPAARPWCGHSQRCTEKKS